MKNNRKVAIAICLILVSMINLASAVLVEDGVVMNTSESNSSITFFHNVTMDVINITPTSIHLTNIDCIQSYYLENRTIILHTTENTDLTSYDFCYSSPTDITHFEIEFNNFTAMIFLILFAFAGMMFLMRLYIFSGSLIALLGFVLLFSSFNPIISFVVIIGGVLCLFLGK